MGQYDMSDLFDVPPAPKSGGKQANLVMILRLLAEMLDEGDTMSGESELPENQKPEVYTRPHFEPLGG